ncbi:hypothetical protein PVAND_004215 [Polypedilum vanderplanki]|uniref:SET domain-containing protein n=1 Tax=Polypedilum vanderplanki TaxID=319348 RepID=A0A9J6BXG3_POLVA|nr:hypothetical protein PVAND_004215 [Polypedilum vanderplanki]
MKRSDTFFSLIQPIENKNSQNSIKFRQEGNKKYKENKIFDAIYNYNKAISFAQTKVDLALAYGNRSAAYFEAGKYEECLKSITFAKETGFPSNKMQQLNEREEKCNKLLKEKKQDPENYFWNYIKLSYPANKKIPWMIKDLEMRTTKEFGRGIYATRDLKVGDIICIEESRIHEINDKGFFKCCNNCAKTNMMNLIPCLKTANFMFCSTDCRDEFYEYADLSLKNFHKGIHFMNKLRKVFGGRENFIQFICNRQTCSIFDFDFRNINQANCLVNIYKCFWSSTQTHIPFIDMFQSPFSNFINYSIHEFHYKNENEVFARSKLPVSNIEKDIQFEKLCFTIFYALLNHSCLSNIDYVCINNTAIFYVKKPIEKNEQLFVAYGDMNMKQHANVLSIFGVFNCDCIACVENLSFHDPPYEDIVQVTKLFCITDFKIHSVSNAMEIISKLFAILNNCKRPISLERHLSNIYIKKIFYFLANVSIFPAQKI